MTFEAAAYWDHNAHYHRWIMRRLPQPPARVLEVGCGDGVFLQLLAGAGYDVVGLESDPSTALLAQAQVAESPRASVEAVDFSEYAGTEPFHAVLFLATVHHLPLRRALVKARDLLAPGGTLLVVGVARKRTPMDHLISAATAPAAWMGSWRNRQRHTRSSPRVRPRDSIGEVAAVAANVLPGVWVRRGVYRRYLLSWRKPGLTARD